MKVTLHFDGACAPTNPGDGAYGWFVRIDDGMEMAGKGALPGLSTNNQAEYAGLGYGLKHLTTMPDFPDGSTLLVKGDSQLIINQVNGSYRCNDETLQKHLARIHVLIKQLAMKGFLTMAFQWIPRDENREADALAKLGWEEAHPGVTFPERWKR